MANLAIATLPGFPFFYAIPIDGQVREIPAPQIWTEEMEGFTEDIHALLQLHRPYFKPPPSQPQQPLSVPLPIVQEVNETLSMIPPSRHSPPDPDKPLTSKTVRLKTVPTSGNRGRFQHRKIRYPSLPIGRWAQPSSSNDDTPKDINGYGGTVPQDPEIIHKRKHRFPPISNRSSWSSLRPSISSSVSKSTLSASISTSLSKSASLASNDLPREPEMPHELEAISAVSPIIPNELDSTPVSELSSDSNSQQSTRSLNFSWYSDSESIDLPPPADESLEPSPQSSQGSFQGDIKENIPHMASLPARPASILLMTEEEVVQAELIESIFLMLHDLQPGYLHPAHRPPPNVSRASMIRQYATQIARRRSSQQSS